MVKGFKITNIDFHQPVTLPAGTYTYSCKARPVWSSITFRVGLTDYVISNLSPGVYQKGIKYTFTVESEQTNFYPSRTVGDEIFEPQLEEGTLATTAGPHILDASEEVSRAGIEINDEMVRTYATKVGVSSEIIQTADSINTRVSNAEGRIGAVEVAADSITTRVSNAEGWIGAVEVTPASINSSVTKSGQIASQILQEDGTVKISAEQITLEGSETASGKFIVTVDGTIKTKGAEIEGSVLAKDSNGGIISTMNEFGDGSYIQYYSSGRKRMEFGGGMIAYFNDDIANSLKWSLGSSGSVVTTTIDRWIERYYKATDANGSNVKLTYVTGSKYKIFVAASSSIYTEYNGLTVKGTVPDAASPNSLSSDDLIPLGWYAIPGSAYQKTEEPANQYHRRLIQYVAGYYAQEKEITFTTDLPQEI